MSVQPHPYAGDNNRPVDAVNNAASAALAAQQVHGSGSKTHLGLIGTGPIHFEVIRTHTSATWSV